MAIMVKDFSWRQTDERVVVRVPLKGVPLSQVDICTMDIYLKANFRPFLFEVFLAHAVREDDSTCTLTDEEAVFDLAKVHHGQSWETLSLELTRAEAKDLRLQLQDRIREKIAENCQKKSELKQKLKRSAVQQQIQLETDERKLIDDFRNSERSKAMDELEEWKTAKKNAVLAIEPPPKTTNEGTQHKQQHYKTVASPGLKNEETSAKDDKANSKGLDRGKKTSQPAGFHASDFSEDSSEDSSDCEIWPDEKPEVSVTEKDLRPIPFPRTTGSIQVSFTHRAFPTPLRESRKPEEDEWLEKQAEIRRQAGFVEEDLRPEECNPDWLKDKGDSFFKVGNYIGAISAYSHGIKLSPKMASLFASRATAQFALGNFQRVVEDCSTALDMMVPAVPQNQEARAKCLTNRGAAFCRLGAAQYGLDDFIAALKLDPDNADIKADIARVQAVLNGQGDDNDSDLDTT